MQRTENSFFDRILMATTAWENKINITVMQTTLTKSTSTLANGKSIMRGTDRKY